MKFVYLGDWFYHRTSTHMPSLITESGLDSDWGKVESALRDGFIVTLRPANKAELRAACDRFDKIVDAYAASGWVFGVGNFDPNTPPDSLQNAIDRLKRNARDQAGIITRRARVNA